MWKRRSTTDNEMELTSTGRQLRALSTVVDVAWRGVAATRARAVIGRQRNAARTRTPVRISYTYKR